jgi:NitT/TauT family transport system permease protein
VTAKSRPVATFRAAGRLVAIQIGAVLVFVLAWQMMTYGGMLNPFYFGQPSQVLAYFTKFLADGTLLRATAVTVAETLAGFALGMGVGVLLGFALWWSRTAAVVLDPFLTALQAVPKITFAPIFILLIGFGFGFKVAVSFAGVVIIALMSTYAGTRDTDADLVDLLRSIGANRWQQFKTVVVPTTLPWIIVSMEINVGFALTGAVVAEFIASNDGLGYMAIYGAGTFDMSLVLVPVITLVLLAAGMYGVVKWIERWLMPWRISDQKVQWAN